MAMRLNGNQRPQKLGEHWRELVELHRVEKPWHKTTVWPQTIHKQKPITWSSFGPLASVWEFADVRSRCKLRMTHNTGLFARSTLLDHILRIATFLPLRSKWMLRSVSQDSLLLTTHDATMKKQLKQLRWLISKCPHLVYDKHVKDELISSWTCVVHCRCSQLPAPSLPYTKWSCPRHPHRPLVWRNHVMQATDPIHRKYHCAKCKQLLPLGTASNQFHAPSSASDAGTCGDDSDDAKERAHLLRRPCR